MRRLLPLLLAALAVGSLAPATAAAQRAETPRERALYHDGQDGRHLLGGRWLFRDDPADEGVRRGFHRQRSTAGWSAREVPDAWNAGDHSAASMSGRAVWYRKDFRLPSSNAMLGWIVRFEAVHHRARVWLNGRLVGSHTGSFLPFELQLRRGLKRRGTNTLVVRVDNRRKNTDVPPQGFTSEGVPAGGWWNYGGIIREVYLRRVDQVDIETFRVQPVLTRRRGPARVTQTAVVRNLSSRTQRVTVTGTFGRQRVRLGTARIGPRSTATLEGRVTVRRPRIWSPERPRLTPATATARSSGGGRSHYRVRTGVRSVEVDDDGRFRVNGRRTRIRGFGMHEDDPDLGSALTNERRERLVRWAEEAGATMLRSHYPLHPHLHELADREGLLIWSEIPVYSMREEALAQRSVLETAWNEMAENVIANGNHPSVAIWSVANELSSQPNATEETYFNGAIDTVRALDPTRPVGLAIHGYPRSLCQTEYARFDVIGVNEYFGWYAGPGGQVADRDLLSGYLDDVRACHPRQAIFVSEFGFEANRNGPVEEKGTYEHQADAVNFHLDVHDSKPWLSGSLYWTLYEFRVRPGWEGGNPRPDPPFHRKGVIRFDGQIKPAYRELQRRWRATDQFFTRDAPPVSR